MRGTPTPMRGMGSPLRGTPRPPTWHASVESGSNRVYRRSGSQPPSKVKRKGLARLAARALALGGLATLSALGVVQVAQLIGASDALPVRTVAVRGVSNARAAEVSAYAGVEPGAPLFSLDLSAVAARVMEHPWVKEATVRVVPPDGIEILVEERRPAAVLAVGELYLLDEAGVPMKAALPGDGLDLPLVTGLEPGDVVDADGEGMDDVRSALALLSLHERMGRPGGTVSEVAIVGGVGLDVVFTSGLRARVGRHDVAAKLARLAVVLEKLGAEGLKASFVHLDDARSPERVAVRLRAGTERLPETGT